MKLKAGEGLITFGVVKMMFNVKSVSFERKREAVCKSCRDKGDVSACNVGYEIG